MSTANGGVYCSKMAQTFPMVTGTEAAVKDVAAGSSGSGQRGPIDEGCCVGRPQPQPDGTRPPLGLRSCSDAQRRRRAGLSTHTDGLVDERTARRAEEAQEAASLTYSFMRLMRI